MAANLAPIFGLTPVFKQATSSAANTARDGTGTLITLVTGAAAGTRIDIINVKWQVTSLAGMIRFFVYDGSATGLWRELTIDATTVSASVPSFEYTLRNADGSALLWLPAAYILKYAVEKAELVNVSVNGWDY